MKSIPRFKYGAENSVHCYNEEERLQLSEFARFFKTDNTIYYCFVKQRKCHTE